MKRRDYLEIIKYGIGGLSLMIFGILAISLILDYGFDLKVLDFPVK